MNEQGLRDIGMINEEYRSTKNDDWLTCGAGSLPMSKKLKLLLQKSNQIQPKTIW